MCIIYEDTLWGKILRDDCALTLVKSTMKMNPKTLQFMTVSPKKKFNFQPSPPKCKHSLKFK